MKLTLQIQLIADRDQSANLLATMARFNEAATFAAKLGFEAGKRSQPGIHGLAYREIRERFGLTSQMAVRAIGKAVEALRSLHAKGETACPEFKPRGAITYDERILRFKEIEAVNLWTLAGRTTFPIVFGEYQANRISRLKGQVDLIYRKGKFYLYATIELPEGSPIEIKGVAGIDFGVVNLAVDSEGRKFSGDRVEAVRRRYGAHRKALQACGTKSAKRRLCKVRKRESGFRRNESHIIAKSIVATAKDTGSLIAIEELASVIGDGKRFRQEQRSRMKGWGFLQLRFLLTYKARLAGVPLVAVDPAYTSRTCSSCQHREKANRKTRDTFLCKKCGMTMDADVNAAINIRNRATANVGSPIVGIDDPGLESRARSLTSPRASAVGL